jgi:ribosomal protein S27AE
MLKDNFVCLKCGYTTYILALDLLEAPTCPRCKSSLVRASDVDSRYLIHTHYMRK